MFKYKGKHVLPLDRKFAEFKDKMKESIEELSDKQILDILWEERALNFIPSADEENKIIRRETLGEKVIVEMEIKIRYLQDQEKGE